MAPLADVVWLVLVLVLLYCCIFLPPPLLSPVAMAPKKNIGPTVKVATKEQMKVLRSSWRPQTARLLSNLILILKPTSSTICCPSKKDHLSNDLINPDEHQEKTRNSLPVTLFLIERKLPIFLPFTQKSSNLTCKKIITINPLPRFPLSLYQPPWAKSFSSR